VNNLAELILNRTERRPAAQFGMAEAPLPLAAAVGIARHASSLIRGAGLTPGKRAAIIGETGNSYLLAWMALQLAGLETALLNPTLPMDLLTQMLAELQVDLVMWSGQEPCPKVAPFSMHVDATQLVSGTLLSDNQSLTTKGADLDGLVRKPDQIAGYMHTSGTTGVPKFCAQTHHYFLSLGRFIADSMALCASDTVFAPLPMFHINPLGYGVVGGLVGNANILGSTRFSASGFWPTVKNSNVTVAFLHAPPVAILKKATSAHDSAGHSLRAVFLADEEFIERFQVPLAYSGYGSTEAGGLCHIWTWRLGDVCPHPEGMSRYAGNPRPDMDWRLGADGEILVKGKHPHTLCDGYQKADRLQSLTADDDWFHTGDAGRLDEQGNLIFIERREESIRVKGEYIPIQYVEQVFSGMASFHEVAIWRRVGELVDFEVVLYVTSNDQPAFNTETLDELTSKAMTLPGFMRPAAVVRLDEMPRGAGVGKVIRRRLDKMSPLEVVELRPLYHAFRGGE
jgi:crotonobetaine/carnitine-CoA ligase